MRWADSIKFFIVFGLRNLELVPTVKYLCLYLLIASVLVWARFYVFLYFVPIGYYSQKAQIRYGPTKSRKLEFILYIVLAIIMAPLFEEIVFRSPVLYYCSTKRVLVAVMICFLFAITFGLLHFVDSAVVRYFSGPTKRPVLLAVIDNSFGGLIYGTLTILTLSLWPAVILHLLNNTLKIVINNKKILQLVTIIQR